MSHHLECHVRRRRAERGVSQAALAAVAGISRQSLSAIESGRATPAVDVALRLGAALGCEVEALFSGADTPTSVEALLLSSDASSDATAHPSSSADATAHTPRRVALAHLDGRWVAHSLSQERAWVSADGVASPTTAGRARVTLTRDARAASQNLMLMGCALGLGALADTISAHTHTHAGRCLWLPASSAAALRALRDKTIHVAGVHLTDPHTEEPNVAAAQRAVSDQPLTLITLARWQAGLVTRPSDAHRLRSIEDIAAPNVTLIRREHGAGAQRLLEDAAARAGLPPALTRDARWTAYGHLEVARAVSSGIADIGPATLDAALAFGLRFIPLAEERYDLVIPSYLLNDSRIEALLNALTSKRFSEDMSPLGYDMTPAGGRVGEVRP
jgi:putative molybdopterin biosynthesis protein